MKMLMGLETQLLKGVVWHPSLLFAHNIKDKSLVWYDWKSAPKGTVFNRCWSSTWKEISSPLSQVNLHNVHTFFCIFLEQNRV